MLLPAGLSRGTTTSRGHAGTRTRGIRRALRLWYPLVYLPACTRASETACQEHHCDSKSSKAMHKVFLARETLAWGVPFFQSNFWGSPGQAAIRLPGIAFSPLSSCGMGEQSKGASFSDITPKGKVLAVCVTEQGEVRRTVGCLSS